MENFLSRLNRNPYQPIDAASITRVDELGNGYDDFGNLIAPNYSAPEQSWGETALGVITAPSRMVGALYDSLTPYQFGQSTSTPMNRAGAGQPITGGSPDGGGWQVPPIVNEGVNALTAVGDAYNYGMSEDEINSRALGMAGFMMGGGGLAARPVITAERAAAGRYAPVLEDVVYPNAYGTTKGAWKAGGFTDEPWQNPFPGHARPVQDPETGGMLWPYDLTERATQRAGDVRGFPDLYSNASKEGALPGISSALVPDESGLLDFWHSSPRVFDRFDAGAAAENGGTRGITYFAEKDRAGPGGAINQSFGPNAYNAKVDPTGAKVLDGRLPFEQLPDDIQNILSSNPDVTSGWKRRQGAMTFDGTPYDANNPSHYAAQLLNDVGDRDSLIRNLEAAPKRSGIGRLLNGPDINEQALDIIRAGKEAKADTFRPGVPLSDQYSMHNFNNMNLDRLGIDIAINPDEIGLLDVNRIKHLSRNGEQLYSNSDSRPALLAGMTGERAPLQGPLSLEYDLDSPFGKTAYAIKDGYTVGEFSFDELPNALMMRDARVDPEFRRQGIASEVYGKLQDEFGLPMTPDITLTPEGYGLWKKNYPEAVKNYTFNGISWRPDGAHADPELGYQAVADGVPEWRMSGGPNRPEGVVWSNADSKPALLAGMAGQEGPFRARGYHGSDRGFSSFREPDDGGLYADLDVPHEGVWMASDPARAEWFANRAYRINSERGDSGAAGPAIYPTDVEFKNPYIHPAELYADEGISSLPSEFELRNLGHDGAVVNRAKWDYVDGKLTLVPEGTDYQALQPNTVRSPLTGEILYSNADSKPALLAGAIGGEQPEDILRLLGYR